MLFDDNRRRIYSLAEVARSIESVINDSFRNSLWIKAEMAKLNRYPESGHCYPNLVEKERGRIKAELRGIIWATDYERISKVFTEVTKESLRDGIEILFRAIVKFSPIYGLSLQIQDIDPEYSLGQMAREKLETIRKLKAEGIFDQNKGVPYPVLPKKIAIISVQTSKGYSDFMNILNSNPWNYRFMTHLFPALLQGDKAIESIMWQLQQIKKLSNYFDIVTIIRGGGGDVGLSCYDDYRLAREVATYPLPVMTGIGHSTNETVVEMVSNTNNITPTDVAYFIIQKFHNFSVKIEEGWKTIIKGADEQLSSEKSRIEEIASSIDNAVKMDVEKQKTALQFFTQHIHAGVIERVSAEKEKIIQSRTVISSRPFDKIAYNKDEMTRTLADISQKIRYKINEQSSRIKLLEEQVRLMDPKTILKRGFTITYHNNKPISNIENIEIGHELRTEFHNGNVTSTVTAKNEHNG